MSPSLVFSTCCWCLGAQFYQTPYDPMDCSPPGPSVHGIFPGKNTAVGCHFLLQGNLPQSHLIWYLCPISTLWVELLGLFLCQFPWRHWAASPCVLLSKLKNILVHFWYSPLLTINVQVLLIPLNRPDSSPHLVPVSFLYHQAQVMIFSGPDFSKSLLNQSLALSLSLVSSCFYPAITF